jgi:cytochrome c peroxidase
MRFSASLTWRTLLLAATLGTVACKHDSDSIDPEGPVVPPTPYVLAATHLAGRPAPPADNPLTVEGVELGRHLFYEKALSADNTVSCGSCHQQAKAFTDGLAHSPGVAPGHTTRSSMSLANLLWEPKLMWDGAASSLEQQARMPIENE